MTIKVRIEFETASHHGSGFGAPGLVDRAILRDHAGMPYLAGSAIKGKLRHAALRLLAAGGDRACGTPVEPEICKCEPWCTMCQIFGSPMKPGAAIFRDAYPCESDLLWLGSLLEAGPVGTLGAGCDIRASTAIDRHTRTVLRQHLFTMEALPHFLRFEGEIAGPLLREQVRFLGSCAKLLNCFGANSARGLGICTYRIEEGEDGA